MWAGLHLVLWFFAFTCCGLWPSLYRRALFYCYIAYFVAACSPAFTGGLSYTVFIVYCVAAYGQPTVWAGLHLLGILHFCVAACGSASIGGPSFTLNCGVLYYCVAACDPASLGGLLFVLH